MVVDVPSEEKEQQAEIVLMHEDEIELLDRRLDREIGLAEEKFLLDQIDQDILKAEEVDLMQRLLRNIEAAEVHEATTQFTTMEREDSVVTHIERPSDASHFNNHDSDINWIGLEKRIHRLAPPYRLRKPVSKVEKLRIRHVKELPKFVDHPKQLLFTRAQFQTQVLMEWEAAVETRFPRRIYNWNARLEERLRNAPNSYLLVVTAPSYFTNIDEEEALLKLLQDKTTSFIKHRFHLYNARKLTGDGESLLLDISVPPRERIGAMFSWKEAKQYDTKYAPENGIWMTGIKDPNTGIAKSLGTDEPFQKGFALVSINGTPCGTSAKVRELGIEHVRSKGNNQASIVTICLSKYANLQGINLSKHPPRRRDLKPFVAEYYAGLKMKKVEKYKTPARSLPMAPPKSAAEMQTLAERMMRDDNSIVIALTISAAQGVNGLGAKFTVTTKGLWVSNFEEGKQLHKLFGSHPCTWGVLLTKANGVLPTIESLHSIINVAGTGTFRATFVVFDGTDIGELDVDSLVTGRANPQRLDGRPHTFVEGDENEEKEESSNGKLASIPRKRKPSGTDTQASKRPRTNDDDDVIDTSLSPPKIDKAANYARFKAKYEPLVSVEYAGSDIPAARVLSSMWKQHKAKFGEDHLCDDNCKCWAKTRSLSMSVTTDYIVKQRKKGKPIGSVETAGIVDCFAPRFLPLLKQEYPNLTPSEYIQRLVDMWRIHNMNKIFGTKCSKDCQCKEEWESVFAKGDIQKANENADGKMSKKRRLDTTSILDKARAAAAAPSATGATAAVGSKYSSAGAVPRKSNQGPAKLMGSQKAYEITFDTYAPLGAYFITEGGKCKVYSIYSKGQFKRDARLAPGTIVDSVMIGSVRNRIKSSDDLEDMYNEADRKPSKKLRIVFINTDVSSRPDTNLALPQKDWNGAGVWQGKRNNGWAGGGGVKGGGRPKPARAAAAAGAKQIVANIVANHPAMTSVAGNARLATARQQVTNQPSNGRDTSVPSARAPNFAADPADPKPVEHEKLTSVSSTVVPKHRFQQPLKSSINKKEGPKKSLKFKPSNEERLFDLEEPTTNWIVRASDVHNEVQARRHSNSKVESPAAAFVKAVESRTYKELIHVLESGCACDRDVAFQGLHEQYDKVKQGLKSVKEALERNPTDSSLKLRQRDLTAKKTILNIYVNACIAIEDTVALLSRAGFEIRILGLKRERPTTAWARSGVDLTGEVKIEVEHKNRPGAPDMIELGSLPRYPAADFIRFQDDQMGCVYSVTNSRRHQLESRSIVIKIFEGPPGGSKAQRSLLAAFKIPLNSIHDNCPPNGSEFEYTGSYTPPDAPNSKVDIGLRMRRCRISADDKKAKIGKKISQLVDWVHRFNQEHTESNEQSTKALTANIQCYGNVSILHAAVDLGDQALVEKLIFFGASPLGKSKLGNAINRTLQLRDRAEENWKQTLSEHDGIHRPEHDIIAQKQAYDSLNRILQTLRKSKVEPRVPQKYLFIDDGYIHTRNDASTAFIDSEAAEADSGHTATAQTSSDAPASSGDFQFSSFDSQPPTWSSGASHTDADHRSQPIAQSEVINGSMARRPSWDTGHGGRANSAGAEPRKRNRWGDLHSDRQASAPNSQASTSATSNRPSWGVAAGNTPSWDNPNYANRGGWGNPIESAPLDAGTQYLNGLAYDWVEKNPRCRRGDKCKFAAEGTCFFWHVQPPILGPITEDPNEAFSLDGSNIVIKELFGYFTAAYTDHETQKIIYVQGGTKSKVSDAGVHWYPTESAAVAALQVVVALFKRNSRSY